MGTYRGYELHKSKGIKYPFKARPNDDADYYYAQSTDERRWAIYYKGKYHMSINGHFHDIVDQLERLNKNIEPRILHN